MRDDKFNTTSGIVNLHPSVGTHWVMFTNQNYFDSYGCPPQLIYLIILKMVFIQNIKFRRAHCLYTLYLTNKIGFKNAVLNLYYQTFKLNK